MSYDVYLEDRECGETLEMPEKHNIIGGTYQLGGTKDCFLNITYNYSAFFYAHIDAKLGLRWLDGRRAWRTRKRLERAVAALAPDARIDSDYWAATPGNAMKAPQRLLTFAQAHPNGRWRIS